MKLFISVFLSMILTSAFAASEVNVYTWANEIPSTVLQQFEKETGIKVNHSTYNSNEMMYAKLKTNSQGSYDVIEPSTYFVQRMRREGMLQQLDKKRIPQYRQIDPFFLSRHSDPKNKYTIPYFWSITGIFYNTKYWKDLKIKHWKDLWENQFKQQLLLLNDQREVFSMALLSLGYSANDTNPRHITQAYWKLRKLLPNIKIFNTLAVRSIVTDEDATIGILWNGDFAKTKASNANIQFILPKEGFLILVDSFAIPSNAPHLDNAYRFINFLMKPEIAKQLSLENGFAITHLQARRLLPAKIRQNRFIYPPRSVLQRGEFQRDIPNKILRLYEKYWELLKLSF